MGWGMRLRTWGIVVVALAALAGCGTGKDTVGGAPVGSRALVEPSSGVRTTIGIMPPLVEVYRGPLGAETKIGYCLRLSDVTGQVHEHWLLANGIVHPVEIDPAHVLLLKPFDDPEVVDAITLCNKYKAAFPVMWSVSYPASTGIPCE